MTWVSNAAMRWANSWPILPRPITPTVLPWISTPESLLRSHSPGAQARVGRRDVARGGQQQREGVLGGGDDVRRRRVDDHDARGGGGRDVDVVQADARASDDRQLLRGREHLGVDLRGRPDEQGVGVGDRGEQRLAVGAVDGADLDLVAEHLQCRRRELLGHQDDGRAAEGLVTTGGS